MPGVSGGPECRRRGGCGRQEGRPFGPQEPVARRGHDRRLQHQDLWNLRPGHHQEQLCERRQGGPIPLVGLIPDQEAQRWEVCPLLYGLLHKRQVDLERCALFRRLVSMPAFPIQDFLIKATQLTL